MTSSNPPSTIDRLLAAASEIDACSEEEAARFFNKVIEGMGRRHISLSWGDRLLTIDKSCGFIEDPGFREALRSIRGSHQYDQYNGADSIAWRLNTLCWAARRGLSVGGDFVECGVFKGDMAWVVSQALGPTRIPSFYLFDSFDGFSPTHSDATDFPDNPGFLDFANRFYKQQGLFEYVRDRFAPYPNIRVIKGFLPEMFETTCPERVGFLHVDLNSPRAEIGVLDKLFDKILPGGAIVFDDYGWKLFWKQKQAADAFMRARSHEILELPSGQGLVIRL